MGANVDEYGAGRPGSLKCTVDRRGVLGAAPIGRLVALRRGGGCLAGEVVDYCVRDRVAGEVNPLKVGFAAEPGELALGVAAGGLLDLVDALGRGEGSVEQGADFAPAEGLAGGGA